MKKEDGEESKFAEEFAKLKGENEAIRAEVNAFKASAERESDVKAAMEELEGKPLGADLEDRLQKFHKEYGASAFKAYVEGLSKSTGVPPGDRGRANDFSSQAANVSEVALKYQDGGTDAVDAAARFSREWSQLKQSGYTRMSEDRYVAVNMAKLTEEVSR